MLHVKSATETADILRKAFGHIVTPVENMRLLDSLGKIMAEDVKSGEHVPGFDRSTVDGYAVYASDTFGAGEAIPAILEFIGEVMMGHTGEAPSILQGQCAYVPTGGMIPKGADAMVMIEDSEDYGDGMRYILKAAAPGRNISFKGDDTRPGETIISAGKQLTPHDVGALAALGISTVNVRKRPVVGVLSTGDEVIDIDMAPTGSQIRDVNGYAICAAAEAAGGKGMRLGIIGDDFELLKEAVTKGLECCDMLVLSGSSSVGERDYAKRVIQKLIDEFDDSELLIHGVSMKPGKPMIVAKIMGKPVFGLPGHPAAACLTFQIFAAPVIASMLGGKRIVSSVAARLAVNVPSNHGREECISVCLERRGEEWQATPMFGKSGLITVLCRSDGYIRIPMECEGLKAETLIDVYLY